MFRGCCCADDDPFFVVANMWRLYAGWYDGKVGITPDRHTRSCPLPPTPATCTIPRAHARMCTQYTLMCTQYAQPGVWCHVPVT